MQHCEKHAVTYFGDGAPNDWCPGCIKEKAGREVMGNKLELLLRKAGRDLADYQIARFWKFPEEMMQTPCDFMGFTRHGRAILIEAKEVNRTALPIHGSPGLAPHQFTALNEANQAGAISLVCWARKNVCAVISFDMVLAFSKGRASVPWTSIDRRFGRKLTGDDAHLKLLDHWLPLDSS